MQFKLVRIDLGTGDVKLDYDLTYDATQAEHSGFALSENGEYFCTISQRKVRIMAQTFREVHAIEAGLKIPSGKTLSARKCGFMKGSTELFVLYFGIWKPPAPASVQLESALMIYDWNAREIVQIVPFKGLVDDAISIAQHELFIIQMEFGQQGFRQRLLKLQVGGKAVRIVWQTPLAEEGLPLQLGISKELVLRTTNLTSQSHGLMWIAPTTATGLGLEVFPSSQPCWARRPVGVNPPTPPDAPCVSSPPPLRPAKLGDGGDDKAHTWRIESGKPGPQFHLSGYWLHAPLTASDDGRWLAIRATHFTGEAGFTRWDDTRFAIFDLSSKRKKPLYLSENFGPDEAIIDLAFAPDGSSLVVATTARLIIYDVKEAPASKGGK